MAIFSRFNDIMTTWNAFILK